MHPLFSSITIIKFQYQRHCRAENRPAWSLIAGTDVLYYMCCAKLQLGTEKVEMRGTVTRMGSTPTNTELTHGEEETVKAGSALFGSHMASGEHAIS